MKGSFKLILALVVFAAGIDRPATMAVAIRGSSNTANVVVVGGECPPKDPVTPNIAALIPRLQLQWGASQATDLWGSYAYRIDLNSDGRREYIVPILCGATGNCTYAIFNSRGTQLLGLVDAWFLYIRTDRPGFAELESLGHFTVNEGDVRRYVFRGRKYHRLNYVSHLEGEALRKYIVKNGQPDCAEVR